MAPDGIQHMEYATIQDAEKYGGGLYAVRETYPDKIIPAAEYLGIAAQEEAQVQAEVEKRIEASEDAISLMRKRAKELGVKSWHILRVDNLKLAIEEAEKAAEQTEDGSQS